MEASREEESRQLTGLYYAYKFASIYTTVAYILSPAALLVSIYIFSKLGHSNSNQIITYSLIVFFAVASAFGWTHAELYMGKASYARSYTKSNYKPDEKYASIAILDEFIYLVSKVIPHFIISLVGAGLVAMLFIWFVS